ncbi:MAG: competence/damage-inducible protein A [Gammaproteobacteria bacterium]|nr:competence/damage-inducible protein A [Gammaproteobacteria bacterium]
MYSAAAIIIGNEVLSGRVQDENLNYLATRLKTRGIRLLEARVIPDLREMIVETVNELRARHDYVFTTGGIGPTHDDITPESVAAAFGVPVSRNEEATRLLRSFYGDSLNESSLRMAMIPTGATLVGNPVSGVPGFKLENVYVLAGVPRIVRAMFESLESDLVGGRPVRSRTVTAFVQESVVADGLARIEQEHPGVEIGSYPFVRQQRFGCALVVRSTEPSLIDAASQAVADLVRQVGGEPEVRDGE